MGCEAKFKRVAARHCLPVKDACLSTFQCRGYIQLESGVNVSVFLVVSSRVTSSAGQEVAAAQMVHSKHNVSLKCN